MEKKEYDELETQLQTKFDDRYVLVNRCNDLREETNKKLANDDKRIAVMVLQQKINNWLTAAIASGIIALVIKVFLGG